MTDWPSPDRFDPQPTLEGGLVRLRPLRADDYDALHAVAADIVDPHGIQFGDAMPKLKGLAQYAERFGDQYRRIEAVAKIGDKFRVLDLKEAATRASVSTATTIKALYESADAFDYLP